MDGLSSTASALLSQQELFQSEWIWAVVVAFHLSFVFAFAMGANEVSNAFATSVSSGAISLKAAYCLATIVESAGGILLGYKVLETLRFHVIDLHMYENSPNELLLGQVAILVGCALWMMSATLFGLPVSSTHSHIGSIIGFSLVMRGTNGLHVDNVIKIMISWVVSPILSGLISATLYIIFDFAVFRRKDSLKCGFRAIPGLYFFVFALNTFVVTYHGSKWIGFDQTPFWLSAVASVAVGLITALIFQFGVRPLIVKWVNRSDDASDEKNMPPNGAINAVSSPAAAATNVVVRHRTTPARINSYEDDVIDGRRESPLSPFVGWLLPAPNRAEDRRTLRLFSAIQVFTGCFVGFSHGSKDIPNVIAPLATLLYVFSNAKVPSVQETPLWFLIYGSLATCVGFWMLGDRVIRTVGEEFTKINPFCGFVVELGASITVLFASKLGIPVAMTLCIVGSIVAVGAVRRSGDVPVNWSLFRNVFVAWVCTFPLSALFSAGATFLLKLLFLTTNATPSLFKNGAHSMNVTTTQQF